MGSRKEFKYLLEKIEVSLDYVDSDYKKLPEVKKYYTSLILHFITTRFTSIEDRLWAIEGIKFKSYDFIDFGLIEEYVQYKNLDDKSFKGGLYKYFNVLDISNWNYIASRKQFTKKVKKFNFLDLSEIRWDKYFSRSYLIWTALTFAIILFIAFPFFNDFGFMKYNNAEFYSSKGIKKENIGKGFMGKTNAIFKNIITEHLEDVELESLADLTDPDNEISKYFTFYIPPNGLARDIRLIEVKVENLSKKDREFYYRSDFSTYIRKQNVNKDIQYFDVSFNVKPTNDNNSPNNLLSLNSIEINKELSKIPLTNTLDWDGNIYGKTNGNLNDAIVFSDATGTYPVLSSRSLEEHRGNLLSLKSNLFEQNQTDFEMILSGDQSYKLKMPVKEKKDSIKINITYSNNNVIVESVDGVNLLNLNLSQNDAKLFEIDTLNFNNSDFLNLSTSDNIFFQLNSIRKFNLLRFIKTETNERKTTVINKNYTSVFEQQISSLLPTIDNVKKEDNISLSLDNFLSSYLEKEIKDYGSRQYENYNNDNITVKIGITVLNPVTGEILAAPFYNSLNEDRNITDENALFFRNSNLDNYHIGSSFKPLLLLNNFMLFPELSNFELHYGTNFTSPLSLFDDSYEGNFNFLGYPFSKSIYGADGTSVVNLTRAIKTSSNAYPLATTLIAMSCDREQCSSNIHNRLVNGTLDFSNINLYQNESPHTDVIKVNGNNTYVENFQNNKIVTMLDTLYSISHSNIGVKDNILKIKTTFDKSIWENLAYKDTSHRFNSISPSKVTTRADLINSSQPLRGNLYSTFIVGAGNNRWNNIKLAEAYSRLFTKRKVKSSILKQDEETVYDPIIPEIINISRSTNINSLNNAWNRLLNALKFSEGFDYSRSYQNINNSLRNLSNNNNLTNSTDDSIVIIGMGKTGTPEDIDVINKETINEFGSDKVRTNGLFALSLMTQNQFDTIENNTEPVFINNKSGIVIVLNVLIDFPKDFHENNDPQAGSVLAKNFFTERRLKNIILLTKEYFDIETLD